MAKLYYPERVEHDIAARDKSGVLVQWLTSTVEAMRGGPPLRRTTRDGLTRYEVTAEGLRDVAEACVRPLREFAGNGQLPSEDVRAVIRDASGALLADVRCTGTLLLPDDIDPQVRRRFVSMLNGGLPLGIRQVDRGDYAAALNAIGTARRLMDDLIAEVAALATREPVDLSWEDVGRALDLPGETAEQWYGRRAG
jgi:hypothetical protein